MLERRGHALDSTPMLFAAPIDVLDLQPRIALDLALDPTWKLVARVNDRAHGVLEPWTMAAVFSTMRDPASHLHVARRDGQAIAALIAREHEGDCYFWFVATVPEAQRSGTASELMRHALREARRHGCTTSSLESTTAAETMYRRLGVPGTRALRNVGSQKHVAAGSLASRALALVCPRALPPSDFGSVIGIRRARRLSPKPEVGVRVLPAPPRLEGCQ